jgi:hypothetical protein
VASTTPTGYPIRRRAGEVADGKAIGYGLDFRPHLSATEPSAAHEHCMVSSGCGGCVPVPIHNQSRLPFDQALDADAFALVTAACEDAWREVLGRDSIGPTDLRDRSSGSSLP